MGLDLCMKIGGTFPFLRRSSYYPWNHLHENYTSKFGHQPLASGTPKLTKLWDESISCFRTYLIHFPLHLEIPILSLKGAIPSAMKVTFSTTWNTGVSVIKLKHTPHSYCEEIVNASFHKWHSSPKPSSHYQKHPNEWKWKPTRDIYKPISNNNLPHLACVRIFFLTQNQGLLPRRGLIS